MNGFLQSCRASQQEKRFSNMECDTFYLASKEHFTNFSMFSSTYFLIRNVANVCKNVCTKLKVSQCNALFFKIVLKMRAVFSWKKDVFSIESVTNDVKVKDLRRCKKTFERFSSANWLKVMLHAWNLTLLPNTGALAVSNTIRSHPHEASKY